MEKYVTSAEMVQQKQANKQCLIHFIRYSQLLSVDNEEILTEAMDFAASQCQISEIDREIILHARQSVLFSNEEGWTKKEENNNNFDVTMGAYDGAEACELVTTFLLAQLQEQTGAKIGMYRDDGLAIISGDPRKVENVKKEICKIFKNNGLKITIEANQKSVNFLDVTMNLTTGKHKPYMKESNIIKYVNIKSNHPPAVLQAVPRGINERLSAISSDMESFNKAALPYQEALKKSGYEWKLQYEKPAINDNKRRQRKRKIIWYNPPYDMRLENAIGDKFIRAIDECFPEGSKLRKIFNRNTIKLSYSCMPNMRTIREGSNKHKIVHAAQVSRIVCKTDNNL